ncbi:hypothetical protein [Halobaculum sp. EA56]|uniref:hypothetical protein n=1 Tax=Halobaculum sp. EA56 TaxID=3421648 RepID=UPI003EBE936E
MELATTPESLSCSECGDGIADTGYLPAAAGDGGYEPFVDGAICDACGYNAVGMAGCAPELDEVTDPGPADVLLFVRRTDDGFDVVHAKE